MYYKTAINKKNTVFKHPRSIGFFLFKMARNGTIDHDIKQAHSHRGQHVHYPQTLIFNAGRPDRSPLQLADNKKQR